LGPGTLAAARQQASSAYNLISYFVALKEIYDTYEKMKAANTIDGGYFVQTEFPLMQTSPS
jgi:hypothetical protein